MTSRERRIARLEQLAAQAARRADRLDAALGGIAQAVGYGAWWETPQVSCAYEDLPTTLKWTQATAAGLSRVTYLTKIDDFSTIMDLSDGDLSALSGKRGWAGDFEPAQVGRGTAYRIVWETAARTYKIDHCFGGLAAHAPYLWDGNTPAVNLGRENLATVKTCSPAASPPFKLTATSAYFGAITVVAHREQPGPRAAPSPAPGPDLDPRRLDYFDDVTRRPN